MQTSKKFTAITAITAVALLAGVGDAKAFEQSAPSNTISAPFEAPDITDENVYSLSFSGDKESGSLEELMAAASLVDSDIKTVVYEGDGGVGQLVLIEGDTSTTVLERADELFASAKTDTPPLTGGLVVASHPLPAEVATDTSTFSISQDSTDPSAARQAPAAAALPAPDGPRYVNWDGYKAIKGWPGYNSVNEWEGFYPFSYRGEGFNLNRCVQLVNGTCQRTTPRANLVQSIVWTGGSHVAYWPDEPNWGFEFGASVYNYAACGVAGFWLNPAYAEWATNVPVAAQPYQDTNRLFDDCSSMSHEMGIRYPHQLIAGAEYVYSLSTERNPSRSSSVFSAAFQAVHNDCLPGTIRERLTDCMGLSGDSYAFPYGDQSETVVNSSRNLTLPGCTRMYSGWARPLRFANGGAMEVPTPMTAPFGSPSASSWDTCFSNDW
ncbi:hypothetical protein [Subtercola boreus]|uniref:hypothetical protein n=1 Tax=Subtercola boreus TaxID=120213 RepID=UPI0011C0287B|nr:hypothetical protein [Subtercola boreus]